MSIILLFLILIAAYFIVRHRYVFFALSVFIIIMEIKTYASRYQIVKINNNTIAFSSPNPFKKRVEFEITKLKKVTVVAANPNSYLFIISNNSDKEILRVNMQYSEFKELIKNMASIDFEISTRGMTVKNLATNI
jgi:hypothetical protein